jgi:sulfur relay (sulfurtransferase) DsrF/TusC family protein
MTDSLLILVTKPPYGFEEAFSGLRAGLGALASGLVPTVNILMVGEGTLNAVAAQRPEAVRMPSNVEAVNDMLDFEAKVYVVREDLLRLVGDVPLLEGVEAIDWEKARQVIEGHGMVTTF